LAEGKIAGWVGLGILLGSLSAASSPLWTYWRKIPDKEIVHQVANEKDFYYAHTSLMTYLRRDRTQPFPLHNWAAFGRKQRPSDQPLIHGNIGFMGYFAPLELVIIDRPALADPYLARRPCLWPWRIGHFDRDIPSAYVEAVRAVLRGQQSPTVDALYRDVSLVTRGPLFDGQRWKAIARLNLGWTTASTP
jgi:arabinofuranosyltransferase